MKAYKNSFPSSLRRLLAVNTKTVKNSTNSLHLSYSFLHIASFNNNNNNNNCYHHDSYYYSKRYFSRTSIQLNNNNNNNFSVSAQEIRNALNLLNLSSHCTDEEVKKSFQSFIKQHHPDLKKGDNNNNNNNNNNKEDNNSNNDRMIKVTQAYQLLRKISAEERIMILKSSPFRNNNNNNNNYNRHYTEEEYQKAQRAYYGAGGGYRNNNNNKFSSAAEEQRIFNETFFNEKSATGRERIQFFNQRTEFLNNWRDRHNRPAAPWKVSEETIHKAREKQNKDNNNDNNDNNTETRTKMVRPSFLERLRYSFEQTKTKLNYIREQRELFPGFAGLDGSRYDSEASTARAQHQINQHPYLKQYILLRERAKERNVLDNAVGRPIMSIVSLILFISIVLLLWQLAKGAYYHYMYERMKEKEDMATRLGPG